MNDEVKFAIEDYLFTWDDSKASANLRKHKISFEMAAEVFADDSAVYIFDEYHSSDEDRMKVIGRIISKSVILSVIYVERVRHDNVELMRIISARNADKKEEELYGMELSGRLSPKQGRSTSPHDDNQKRRY